MINDAREGWSDFLLISINKLIFISCKELLILIYKSTKSMKSMKL